MGTFSVVIPWCNRRELKETLAASAPFFERHAVEVLVVNCGGDPDHLADILRDQPISLLRQVSMPGASFNRALAKNVGVLCSSGRYLVFLDADTHLVSDLFEEAYPKLERRDCFVHVGMLYESEPTIDPALSYLNEIIYTQHMVLKDGRVARLRTRQGSDGSGCAPGLMAMSREHFLEVGGFNSALVDWGFEDFDMHIRLQVAANLSLESAGQARHLTHGNEKREINGVNVRDGARRNKLKCAENYTRGSFVGTYHEDVQLWRDKVRAIPAASLDAALR